MNEFEPQINVSQIGGFIIAAISVGLLPFPLYLIAHPDGLHPPLLIILPVVMFVVGLDVAFPRREWNRVLRWSSLVVLAVGSITAAADCYMLSINPFQNSGRSFFGACLAQYLFILGFSVLLLLRTSNSEKIRQISSPLFWSGFVFIMLYLFLPSAPLPPSQKPTRYSSHLRATSWEDGENNDVRSRTGFGARNGRSAHRD
jgi:uncharacterized membrane protein